MQPSMTLHSTTLTFNSANREFYFRGGGSSDQAVMTQIFRQRDYDLGPFKQSTNLMAYYTKLTTAGLVPLIVDAGANIGASTVWFALTFPGSHVVAIEPEKRNCELIQKNCLGLNYSLLEGGIGCRDGESFLHDPGRGEWAFRLSAQQGLYRVPVFAASSVVRRYAQKGFVPFLMKIDIEGGEAELFSDDLSWLHDFPAIVIELHDWLLPGTSTSKNFRNAVADMNIDFATRGENVFVFNYDAYT